MEISSLLDFILDVDKVFYFCYESASLLYVIRLKCIRYPSDISIQRRSVFREYSFKFILILCICVTKNGVSRLFENKHAETTGPLVSIRDSNFLKS